MLDQFKSATQRRVDISLVFTMLQVQRPVAHTVPFLGKISNKGIGFVVLVQGQNQRQFTQHGLLVVSFAEQTRKQTHKATYKQNCQTRPAQSGTFSLLTLVCPCAASPSMVGTT